MTGTEEFAAGPNSILLVEDEAAVRRLAAQILEDYGYSVRSFATAEELLALPKAHVGRYSLLLSDVRLPGQSGLELAQRVSAQHPQMRIVLMSGYVDNSNRDKVYQWPFLAKPFTLDELIGKVQKCLAEDR